MSPDALTAERLRALVAASSTLLAETSAPGVHRALLEVVPGLVDTRAALVGLRDPDDGAYARIVGAGARDRERLAELGARRRPLHGARWDRAEHARGRPALVAVPLVARGRPHGSLAAVDPQTGAFSPGDVQALELLAGWAAAALDGAALVEREQRRTAALERAVRGLKATINISRAVSTDAAVGRVLDLVVHHGLLLVGARAMLALQREADELVVAAQAGGLERDLRGVRFALDGTLGGEVLRLGRARRVDDEEARVVAGAAALGLRAASLLAVPMTFRGEGHGVILAVDRAGGAPRFDREDERLLSSFAASAATALATTRSASEARLRRSHEAAERERRRWARELHDDTLQGLGGLKVRLDAALARPGELEPAVRDAVDGLGLEIESLRSLIEELRPRTLDQLGLRAALQTLVDRLAQIQDVPIDAQLALPDGQRLDPDVEVLVYRLVQEALNNVVKHAEAAHVLLSVRASPGLIEVVVDDDGLGFDPAVPSPGVGLVGMRERAALARGELDLRSSPGQGTSVRVRVPTPRS